MYRAARSLTRGDLVGTRTHGRRALETAPADDHLVRSAAGGLVGLAAWYAGEIDAAYDGFATSVEGLRREGHLADVLGCTIILADLRVAQGRLRDAHRLYADGLALGTSALGAPLRGTADMHVGLADIHRERGELAAARDHVQRSAALGAANGLPQHPYRSKLVGARLCAAEGDLVAAHALLDEAERVYTTDFLPGVRPIPAVRAALLAQHDHLDDALAWAAARGLRAQDELTYVGELEHVVLARVLVARGRVARDPSAIDEAIGLLTRVADAAASGGRAGDLLPVLVVLALAEDARGRRAAAVAHLDRALGAAEPEGYVRVFLDEGPQLQPLLAAAAASREPSAFVRGLLGAGPAAVHAAPNAARLVDPLSARELDVLRLLATDLTGPEIARELSVSLNTVRTHTKRIYTKLGVTNRRAAVRAAAVRALVPWA